MGEREREGKEWVEWGGRETDRQTGGLIGRISGRQRKLIVGEEEADEKGRQEVCVGER